MDIKLYYTEKGSGEPLILLHGNGENSDYFINQIDAFSVCFHVYAVDTRGHGRSPRGSGPFTISRFADDLKDFVDEHSIEKAHILGFSDGGNIALVFAIRYPEKVNKLILNGANLNTKGVKASIQIPIEIGYRVSGIFARRSEEAKRKHEILGLMVDSPNIPVEDLGKVSAETLVIAGTRDLIKESQTRVIAGGIPNAKLVFVEGDHCIAAKNPADFNKEVLDFCMGEGRRS